MVRTENLWRYTNTIKLSHHHDGAVSDAETAETAATWSTLTSVTDSEWQGWELLLECGCKLQSCFGDTEWDVQMILSDEVANWCKI